MWTPDATYFDMKAVGLRELKNRLSEYLRLVRAGEDILVTDRGEVVAQLRRPGREQDETPYPGLNELIRKGVVGPALPNDPSLYRPLGRLLSHEEVMGLLDEERGER
jgi:antitoxin (DNA-binding transcriptional repressor) of toxin-antitoxin stability system